MIKLRHILPIVLMFVAACTAGPPAAPVINQTFEHLSVLPLTTSAPAFVDESRQDAQTQKLIRRGVGPKDLIIRWIGDRLRPSENVENIAATQGELVFILTRAELRQKTGKKSTPYVPFYSRDTLEMTARIGVTLAYRATPQGRIQQESIEVTASATHIGGVSLNDRDRLYFTLLQNLGKNFDASAAGKLRKLGVLAIVD